jgi:hypothetical protein
MTKNTEMKNAQLAPSHVWRERLHDFEGVITPGAPPSVKVKIIVQNMIMTPGALCEDKTNLIETDQHSGISDQTREQGAP